MLRAALFVIVANYIQHKCPSPAEERNKLRSYFKSLLFGTFLLYAPEPLLSQMCHLLILYFTLSLFHYPVCWMTESNFRQIPTPTKNTTIKNIWGVKKMEKEPSYTVGPNVSWKELWKFLKKLKTESPYDPATQFLGIFLKKILI